MVIKEVRGENFRVYPSVRWTVPTIGLHQIEGHNLDTGRSNMVGKSTILDLLAWTITGSIPRGGLADNVVRRGAKSCWGEVDLEHNGNTITIRRERPAKLQLLVNGKKVDGKASDLDSRIPEFIGMSYDQFLLSVLIAQERKKSFFSMSDTERTEFLSVVAGLGRLDEALDKTKSDLRTLETQLTIEESKASVLKTMLDEQPEKMKAAVLELERLGADLGDTDLALYSANQATENMKLQAKEESELSLTSIKSVFFVSEDGLLKQIEQTLSAKKELEAQLALVPQLDQKYSMDVANAKAAFSKLSVKNADKEGIVRENTTLKEKMNRELDLMEVASQGTCTHCAQDLPKDQRENAAATHFAKAQALSARIKPEETLEDVSGAAAAVETSQAALTRAKLELEAEPKKIKDQITRMNEILLSLQKELQALKSDLQAKTQEILRTLESAERAAEANLATLKSEKDRATYAHQAGQKDFARLSADANGLSSKYKESADRTKALQLDQDELLDLIDLFGPKGFRTVCFEGVIARISDRAAQLFSAMTDGVYSTRLDQVGETAKGEARLILKPVIAKGGIDVPVDDLSGGAKRNITLAYDIAVTEACGDSSVLFLDEVLYGLDPIGASEALRLLEEVSMTRAVVVIEHASEIKTGIMNSIRVLHKNGVSWIDEEAPAGSLESAST